ncbi:hypothetical protein C1H46_038408 [Malus baccata]|uniref:Uncharacterized protein n=1 Tax=Malus baccata TaxID=106549 RepID=A0A540KPB2_MALBA|nr:hypothetical protein C1H46_038408 [Malus baccata]
MVVVRNSESTLEKLRRELGYRDSKRSLRIRREKSQSRLWEREIEVEEIKNRQIRKGGLRRGESSRRCETRVCVCDLNHVHLIGCP